MSVKALADSYPQLSEIPISFLTSNSQHQLTIFHDIILGHGSSAVVCEGEINILKKEVKRAAVKISKLEYSHFQVDEEKIHTILTKNQPKDKPFVPKILYGNTFNSGKSNAVRVTFMDLIESDLNKIIKKFPNGLTLSRVRSFAKQLFLSADFLIQQGILHGDLKPANLLIDSSDHLLITDFGLAARVGNVPKRIRQSPSYRCPEMALDSINCDYSAASDVWSIGCIIAELIRGKELLHLDLQKSDPETKKNVLVTLEMIRLFGPVPSSQRQTPIYQALCQPQNEPKLAEAIRNYDDGQTLRTRLLQGRVDVLTAEEEADIMDLLSRIFRYLPEERITPSDALQHRFFANQAESSLQASST